jgi:DNA polymerase-1
MKTFKQLANLDPNTLMIVDALNLCFSFRGKKNFSDKYLSMIESLQRSYKAGKVIIACDHGSSSYRKNIFPGYKENRVATRSKQTEAERLEFEAFFAEFSSALDILKSSEYEGKYEVLQYKSVEADDIAAYIVRKHKKDFNIWLMSSDRDWDLLIDKQVSRFSYVTRKEITYDNWHEHYEYDMDKHLSIKSINGDSGDGIPGVDGIGPKRAQALIEEYGDIFDLISSLPISSKFKYVQSLNSFGAANLLRNCNLMDLESYCEEAIGEENCKDIDTRLKEYLSV